MLGSSLVENNEELQSGLLASRISSCVSFGSAACGMAAVCKQRDLTTKMVSEFAPIATNNQPVLSLLL